MGTLLFSLEARLQAGPPANRDATCCCLFRIVFCNTKCLEARRRPEPPLGPPSTWHCKKWYGRHVAHRRQQSTHQLRIAFCNTKCLEARRRPEPPLGPPSTWHCKKWYGTHVAHGHQQSPPGRLTPHGSSEPWRTSTRTAMSQGCVKDCPNVWPMSLRPKGGA